MSNQITEYERKYNELGIEMIRDSGYATVWKQEETTYYGIRSGDPSREVVYEVTEEVMAYCQTNDITLNQIAGSWGPSDEFKTFLQEANFSTVDIAYPPGWSEVYAMDI
jgi:hypothetical protein